MGICGRELSTAYRIKRRKLLKILKRIGLLCLKNFHKGDFWMMLCWQQKPNLRNSFRRSFILNFHTSKDLHFFFGGPGREGVLHTISLAVSIFVLRKYVRVWWETSKSGGGKVKTCNFDGYVLSSWLVHFWGPNSDHDWYKNMARNGWIDRIESENCFIWMQYINLERTQCKIYYLGHVSNSARNQFQIPIHEIKC